MWSLFQNKEWPELRGTAKYCSSIYKDALGYRTRYELTLISWPDGSCEFSTLPWLSKFGAHRNIDVLAGALSAYIGRCIHCFCVIDRVWWYRVTRWTFCCAEKAIKPFILTTFSLSLYSVVSPIYTNSKQTSRGAKHFSNTQKRFRIFMWLLVAKWLWQVHLDTLYTVMRFKEFFKETMFLKTILVM